MIKRTAVLCFALFSVATAVAQHKTSGALSLRKGTKLTSSAIIIRKTYNLPAGAADSAGVILIQGNNIVIDFKGAILQGSADATLPDEFRGTAIVIRDSRSVTIRNLTVRGYKTALRATNVNGLIIEQCDFSYNYRPRLSSTQQRESTSDWLSFHHNDNDEWLQYGAGMYLSHCDSATVHDCIITGGQNGLLMNGCSEAKIYNNDFSFNSGVGMGFYRSSHNYVCNNRLIFNVRGYSHGVYNRGQDSAGILVYEQSSDNIFYRNNVTHGGDGFFLWAGQTTMDAGMGGCNNNLVAENDFSFAATNGMEATFSRNTFYANRAFECEYGFWGGYSFETAVLNNQFRNNKTAVAIEHGQNNSIAFNIFFRDKKAIRLWANAEEASDWGYPKYRNTHSHGYTIVSNSFNGNEVGIDLAQTDSLTVFNNSYSNVASPLLTNETVDELDTLFKDGISQQLSEPPAFEKLEIANPIDPFKGASVFAGRKNIRMLEWGPYDFKYPLIWLTNPADSGRQMKFEIIGPKGKWRVKTAKGVSGLSATSGTFPAIITADRKDSSGPGIDIQLQFAGEAVTTQMGKHIVAGKSFTFGYSHYFQPLTWAVLFYSLDTAHYNPLRTGQLFSPTVRMAPIKTDTVNELHYNWWNGLMAARKYTHFMTIATAKQVLPAGAYELLVTWGDAVRVFVNNQLVLDEWHTPDGTKTSSPTRRIAVSLNGSTDFRVEHLALGSFATLGLTITKR